MDGMNNSSVKEEGDVDQTEMDAKNKVIAEEMIMQIPINLDLLKFKIGLTSKVKLHMLC